MKRTAVVCVLLLSSCATVPREEMEHDAKERATHLVGSALSKALWWWGAPTSHEQTGSLTVYQWESWGDQHKRGVLAVLGPVIFGGIDLWQEHCRHWVVVDDGDTIVEAGAAGECR